MSGRKSDKIGTVERFTAEGVKFENHFLPAYEGAQLQGADPEAKGEQRINALVEGFNRRYYIARLRKSDRKVLFRWGELITCKASYINGKFVSAEYYAT